MPTELETKMATALLDFVMMAENEIQRIRTGKAPGPSMRDVVGQWEATVREARELLMERRRRDGT